jgi:plastocyanin
MDRRCRSHANLRVAICTAALFCGGVPTLAAPPGTLAGTVRLAGPGPESRSLPVYKSQQVCGNPITDERLVVGPGGGVRYAVVTVEGVRDGRKPARDTAIVLDNRLCRFEPHVQTAEVGQSVELRNSDPILHNADARMGHETLFNVALTPGREVRKPLARAGLIAVTCDVRHTWMKAYIAVAEHPYHGVTDAEGAYEIRDLPPGTYSVRVWLEELGTQEQRATIAAGEVATLDIAYSPPKPREVEAP